MRHDVIHWEGRMACKYGLDPAADSAHSGEIALFNPKTGKTIAFDRQEVQLDPDLCEQRVRMWCGR